MRTMLMVDRARRADRHSPKRSQLAYANGDLEPVHNALWIKVLMVAVRSRAGKASERTGARLWHHQKTACIQRLIAHPRLAPLGARPRRRANLLLCITFLSRNPCARCAAFQW